MTTIRPIRSLGDHSGFCCAGVDDVVDTDWGRFSSSPQNRQAAVGAHFNGQTVMMNLTRRRLFKKSQPTPTTMLLLLLLVAVVRQSSSFVHENPECGEPFHCPDECVITWYGKCPSNCYCKPIKRCETVKCPHPAPKCIIVTGQDGCQRCACENDMETVNKAVERERMNTKATKTTTLVDETSVPSETTTPTITTTTTTSTTTAMPTPTSTDAEISETPKFVTRPLTTGHVTTPTTVTETWTTKPFLLQSTTVDLPIRNNLEFYAKNICTQENKREIDENFKRLYLEVGKRLKLSDIYPSVFSFDKVYLEKVCEELKEANRRTRISVRRNCFRKYYVFDELISLLSYPCSWTTREEFFKHFSCIQTVARGSDFGDCLPKELPTIVRRDIGLICPTFNNALPCLRRVLTGQCSNDGWDTFKQYLVIRVLKMDPLCHLQLT
ncbi:hypothetical protein T10_4480 [Trichinella papuae]|uniref:Uncharacterized protein n=1 Tax=Trichinella papuae TaxID=268474 RepID=A0A0V1MNY0_9BILA|nr:hypothetical protein T10_4480 [Trichinella papuae]